MKAVPRRDRWQVFYNELVEYKRVHGTTLVPVHKSALGKWIGLPIRDKLAGDYKSDKRANGPTLNEARIQQLNDIGFVWNVHDKIEAAAPALVSTLETTTRGRGVEPTDAHASGGDGDGHAGGGGGGGKHSSKS
jgi:Helicase associated domain